MTIQTMLTNSKSRFGQIETWTWGLLNAIIMGGSSSVVSWIGMSAAKGAGLDVPTLNFKAVGVIFISGAMVKFFAYLSQGLPMLTQTVDTSFVTRKPDGSTTAQTSQTVTTVPVAPAPPTSAKSGLTSPEPGPMVVPKV